MSDHSSHGAQGPQTSRGTYRGRGGISRGAPSHKGGGYDDRTMAHQHDPRYPTGDLASRRNSHSGLSRPWGRAKFGALEDPAETFASLPGTSEEAGSSDIEDSHGVAVPRRRHTPVHPSNARPHIPSSPDVNDLDSLDKLMRYHAKLTGSRTITEAHPDQQHLTLVAETFLQGKRGKSGSQDTLVGSDALHANSMSTPEPGEIVDSPRTSTLDPAARAKELKDELLRKKWKARWEASTIKKEAVHTPLPAGPSTAELRQHRVPTPTKRQRVEHPAGGSNIASVPSHHHQERPRDVKALPQGPRKDPNESTNQRRANTRGSDSHHRDRDVRQRPDREEVQPVGPVYEPLTTNFVPERYRHKQDSIRPNQRRSRSPPRVVVQPPSTSTVSFLG